ncbi:MAG: UDP-N-acetylglucosamine 4,6-dehydratase (inverting) [Bacteriovoracaceae bacterium]|jgi:UDP-N-acetylglucosamine 4,6-dehydratase/5-epimerase|nr:UDP-N-acetylglucosamine 4,6-dehydratase (inverting) [Bacteriovoracaceae bacterium]
MLNGRSILITGGSGSFGKKFVDHVVHNYPNISRLVIYSRDELKQFEMAQLYPPEKYPFIRFFLGDVRDRDRLTRACEGIDLIVHAAALKQVPAAEYNPMEFIKTNVLGAENLIEACFKNGVKDLIALSTDKAAAPVNLYGATKLCSDKLFVAANNMKGSREIKFSVVRYGNVLGSRGSVVPFFLNKRDSGVIPITDPEMTRFTINLSEAVEFVIQSFKRYSGGEIFIPKLPSYKITDLAEAIAPKCEVKNVGIRPGEKIHEEMITLMDSPNTLEFDDYFAILPPGPMWDKDEYMKKHGAKPCEPGFYYHSGNNTSWLTVEEIRKHVKDHVDPNFTV